MVKKLAAQILGRVALKLAMTGPGRKAIAHGLKKSLQRQFRESITHKVIQSVGGGQGKAVRLSSDPNSPVVKALRSGANEILNHSEGKLKSSWNTYKNSSLVREAIAKEKNKSLAHFLAMDRKAIGAAVDDIVTSKRTSRYQRGNKLSMKFGFTSPSAASIDSGASNPLKEIPPYHHVSNVRPFMSWLNTFPETSQGLTDYFSGQVKLDNRRRQLLQRIGIEIQNALRKNIKK